MELFTIYYMNAMQEQEHEIVACKERPTNEEALAYLIKYDVVGEDYDDGVEVYQTAVSDLDGNTIAVKVEQ